MAAMKSQLAIVVALLGALPARADDKADAAREHYRQGTQLYDLRRYREAAHEYEAAYQAKEDPALLFNIAQAYRLAGMYDDAIASYRAYLRHVPHSPNRTEVVARIQEMQDLAAAQRKQQEMPPEGTLTPPETPPREPAPHEAEPARPTPPSREPDAELHRGRTLKLAGIGLFAGGLVAIGVGAAFAVLAKQASDQVSSAQVFDPSVESRGKTDQAVGIALLSVGGAAIAAGVATWLVGRHVQHRSSFVLLPSLGGALAEGTW
jgi:tetratricopeptide (TPR) repeat protein